MNQLVMQGYGILPCSFAAVHQLTPLVPQAFSRAFSNVSSTLHKQAHQLRHFNTSSDSAGPTAAVSSDQAVPKAAPCAAAVSNGGRLDFNDSRSIFNQRSFTELLRMYAVLKVCSITPLVKNADAIVRASRRFLGDGITFGVMRHTFMKQFCAGEKEDDLSPTINMLRANGIGTIIDYAAEDDVEAALAKPASTAAIATAGQPSPTASTTEGSSTSSSTGMAAAAAFSATTLPGAVSVGRTYSYEDEAACDRHVNVFLQAIATGAKLPEQGFAAIKVTALGNPMLLERMSAALLEIRSLFREADTDGDGYVDRTEFGKLYSQLYPNSTKQQIDKRFAILDVEGNGKVDVISWSHRIHLADMPGMVQRIKKQGTQNRLSEELCAAALTKEEVQLAQALLNRVAKLAEAAVGTHVKLMIDAEHTYFQPAIDHMAHVLSLKYNRKEPIIFNTYQAYLKGSYNRLLEDMERARREGYVFAAKLVRGAYVQLERKRALKMGYESPIWGTIDSTHDNYNKCLEAVLDEVAQHKAQVMVASHNQASIERTVAGMADRGLSPADSGVFFGQLLGMADNLTFTLGQNGYKAFKYVPYGPIDLVMPYLIRRAVENSSLTKGPGMTRELAMLRTEMWRRLNPLAAASSSTMQHKAAA